MSSIGNSLRSFYGLPSRVLTEILPVFFLIFLLEFLTSATFFFPVILQGLFPEFFHTGIFPKNPSRALKTLQQFHPECFRRPPLEIPIGGFWQFLPEFLLKTLQMFLSGAQPVVFAGTFLGVQSEMLNEVCQGILFKYSLRISSGVTSATSLENM